MTGEDLYFIHRGAMLREGMTIRQGINDQRLPLHWYEVDEKQKRVWDATARELNEQQAKFAQTMRRTHGRQIEVHGTPREGEGMLSGVRFEFPR
jgi:hypothetical protein